MGHCIKHAWACHYSACISLMCASLLRRYPDETWHMDYFNEYYELVRKQQETEYNYTYEDSFTSMASISLV